MTEPTLTPFMSVRICPKCGTTLVLVETDEETGAVRLMTTSALHTAYHQMSQPGMKCWRSFKYLEDYGPEHLCRLCRICQYDWIEQIQDPS
jgi:hypothetical protein